MSKRTLGDENVVVGNAKAKKPWAHGGFSSVDTHTNAAAAAAANISASTCSGGGISAAPLQTPCAETRTATPTVLTATPVVLAACRAALLEGPAACRAALAKYQASIDSALAKTLEAVGCYEHKVLAPPCSSPHLELGSLLSGFLCSLRVSDYFLFLCTYLQDGRSSLHESVARGDEATAQVLIAAGADMVAKDEVKESS